MYKFSKRSTQMIHFNEVFESQLNAKTISIGLASLFGAILIILSIFFSFLNIENSEAQQSGNTITIANTNGQLVTGPANDNCFWECLPRDSESCYTAWSGSTPYEYTIRVETFVGWVQGTVRSDELTKFEPGHHDIRGFDEGVEYDNCGYCSVNYEGCWVEDGTAYHHWTVTSNNYYDTYQDWSGSLKTIAYGGIVAVNYSLWSWTERCREYSFDGFTFYIYKTYEDAEYRRNPVGNIVLGVNGLGVSEFLYEAEKTYYVRPSSIPGEHGHGYLCKDDIGQVDVIASKYANVLWGSGYNDYSSEPIVSNTVLNIQKTDAQTNSGGVTEGSVETFEDAYYDIEYRCDEYKNYVGHWVMKTNEQGVVGISEKFRDNFIEGDEFLERDGQIMAPLGTYFVHEVRPSPGYLLSEKEYRINVFPDPENEFKCKVTCVDVNNGTYQPQTIDSQTGEVMIHVDEQVIRGDYKFRKVNTKGQALSGIPFKITSKTTGEWHICVSDDDGIIDTSTSFDSRTALTNCNDYLYDEETNSITNEDLLTSNCGVWFAYDKKNNRVAPAEDNMGAFPFDEYIVEEIPVLANSRYDTSDKRTFKIEENDTVVEGADWINKERKNPINPVNPVSPTSPASNATPKTGDTPLYIFGITILAVLCYIMRRWVYCRKY